MFGLESIFGGGSSAGTNWSDQNQKQVIDPLTGKVTAGFEGYDPAKAQASYDPFFTGAQAQSLEQGSKGYLGKAGGMFNSGKGALQGNANGANDWLSSILNPSFMDINNNPQIQGVLNAMVNQSQRGFNVGADKIAGNAAQTSSGLGKSTATTDALAGLGANISSNLSDQTANFLQGELARRQGLQQNASQQSLADRLGQANAYGNLGQGLGQLGIAQGNQALDMAKYVQGQQQMGANFGLEQMMRLAALLKSPQSQAQPSLWDNIGSLGSGIGNALGGFSNIMGKFGNAASSAGQTVTGSNSPDSYPTADFPSGGAPTGDFPSGGPGSNVGLSKYDNQQYAPWKRYM